MRTKRNFYKKQNKQHKNFSIVSYTPPTNLKQKKTYDCKRSLKGTTNLWFPI